MVTVDPNTLTDAPSSTGGNAPDYGLGKYGDALFDTTGLFGPGGGQVKGKDLLDTFIHMGTTGSQADSQIVAAIETALLYSGAYDDGSGQTKYVPKFGKVTEKDAKVLAAQLVLLGKGNEGRGPAAPQSLVGFLSSGSASGIVNGGFLTQHGINSTAEITVPSAADVAKTYEKVAAQVTGEKPDPAETQRFVATYQQQYIATQRANASAALQTKMNEASAAASAANVALPFSLPAPGLPVAYQGGSANAADFTQNGPDDPGYQGGSATAAEFAQNGSTSPPPSFQEQMMSLSDAVNAATGKTPAGTLNSVIEQSPVSDATAAENYARNKHPNEAAANDIADTFNTFLNLVTGKLA